MGLKKATISGLSWSMSARLFRQISQFTVTAILARFLAPEDFGLMGMVTVFTGFALLFNDLGAASAIIQQQNVDERHYSSVFWLNILVGLMLTGLFVLLAPAVAAFFGKPQLQSVINLVSVSFTILSAGIVQRTILQKHMDFKDISLAESTAVFVSGVCSIIFALSGYGVWSLAYKVIIYSSVSTMMFWAVSEWKPKMVFSYEAVKDLFAYSMNLTGFRVLNYFARNIDNILIGRFLGAEALGLYSLAYSLMLYPLSNISAVIGSVTFPVFSQIQNDIKRVQEYYLKMVRAISLVSFPLMVGLFVLAPEFVILVLGPKWSPLVPLLRILSVCGMLQSIGTTIGSILQSQGRADLQFRLQILGTAVVITSVLLGLRWGVRGVALLYTLQSVVWVHLTLWITTSVIRLDFRLFYSKLLNSYMISLLMGAGLLFFKRSLYQADIASFLMIVALGAALSFMLALVRKEIVIREKRLVLGVLE